MTRAIRYSLPALFAAAFIITSAAVMYWAGHASADAGVVALDAMPPIDAGPDVTMPAPAPATSTSDLLTLWRGGQIGAAIALALHTLLPRLVLAWPLLAGLAPALATRRRLALVSSLAAGVGSIVPLALTGEPVLLALSWQVAVAVALWLWPGMRQAEKASAAGST